MGISNINRPHWRLKGLAVRRGRVEELPSEWVMRLPLVLRKGFAPSAKGFPERENDFPARENHFPERKNGFPVRENEIPAPENDFPVWENEISAPENDFPVRENEIYVRGKLLPSGFYCHSGN